MILFGIIYESYGWFLIEKQLIHDIRKSFFF